jgi:hypothetical protein
LEVSEVGVSAVLRRSEGAIDTTLGYLGLTFRVVENGIQDGGILR